MERFFAGGACDFENEVNAKTVEPRGKIADLLTKSITKHEAEVRNIDFYGAGMSNNSFAWQMVGFVLYDAVIEILQNRIQVIYPKDRFGTECFVWGTENSEHNSWRSKFGFGISNVSNSAGDYVQFMDFPINGEMVHHYCFNHQNVTNVFWILLGETQSISVKMIKQLLPIWFAKDMSF